MSGLLNLPFYLWRIIDNWPHLPLEFSCLKFYRCLFYDAALAKCSGHFKSFCFKPLFISRVSKQYFFFFQEHPDHIRKDIHTSKLFSTTTVSYECLIKGTSVVVMRGAGAAFHFPKPDFPGSHPSSQRLASLTISSPLLSLCSHDAEVCQYVSYVTISA